MVANERAGARMSALLEEVRTALRLPPPTRAREIRMAAGISQQRLADELGVDRVTVARWELGDRRPRGQLLMRYARVLIELQRAVLAPDREEVAAGV
jgi:transcriptional regulator with XRE-family HTH domain